MQLVSVQLRSFERCKQLVPVFYLLIRAIFLALADAFSFQLLRIECCVLFFAWAFDGCCIGVALRNLGIALRNLGIVLRNLGIRWGLSGHGPWRGSGSGPEVPNLCPWD